MQFNKTLLSILLITVIVISCDSLFNDEGPIVEINTTESESKRTMFNGDTLIFKPVTGEEMPHTYPEFTSEIKGSQIFINGYYLAPAAFVPVVDFNLSDSNILTVHLEQSDSDDTVLFIPVGYFYTAYIRSLSSGTYTVKIIHEDDLMRGHIGERHKVFEKKFVIK